MRISRCWWQVRVKLGWTATRAAVEKVSEADGRNLVQETKRAQRRSDGLLTELQQRGLQSGVLALELSSCHRAAQKDDVWEHPRKFRDFLALVRLDLF